MPEALIPVNIAIGDRTYRIKILPSDEEAVRKSLKQIHSKILEFRTQFAGKDMQDYISMVLIWYATQPSDRGTGEIGSEALIEQIRKMESQITEFLP